MTSSSLHINVNTFSLAIAHAIVIAWSFLRVVILRNGASNLSSGSILIASILQRLLLFVLAVFALSGALNIMIRIAFSYSTWTWHKSASNITNIIEVDPIVFGKALSAKRVIIGRGVELIPISGVTHSVKLTNVVSSAWWMIIGIVWVSWIWFVFSASLSRNERQCQE